MAGTPDPARLAPLAELTDMVFQAELAVLARITEEEQRLRRAIVELDEQAKGSFLSDIDRGGDIRILQEQDNAWREWLGRQRLQLTQKLARTLAEKSERKARLTRALGRKDVAAALLRDARATRNARRQARQLDTLQDLALMKLCRED